MKEVQGLSKKIYVLTSFVLFLNLFFLKTIGHFGLSSLLIATLSALIFGFLTLPKLKKHVIPITFLTVVVVTAALILLTRANQTVTDIFVILGLNLLLLTHYTLANERFVSSSIELLLISSRTFTQYLKTLAGIFSGTLFRETHPQVIFSTSTFKKYPWISIVVGLVASVPVLFVLLTLLSAGDPIFGKAVRDFLNSPFIKELIPRIILSLAFFVGLLPFLFIKHPKVFRNPVAKLQSFNFIHEYSVVMTLVALVLALFLLVQWQYIFIPPVSGIDLSQFGFSTYSEYVNRGFNELLVAAFFIYVLVWIGLIFVRSPHTTNKKLLKILQIIVLSEFTIFLLSVFRRIYLYQHYHGLTLIRVYGGFFLLLLLGYTAILFARHFWTKRWVLADIAITLVLAVIFGLFNVENEIALNSPPTVNNRIDFTYLARLSTDGYEGWKKSYRQVQTILNNHPDKSFNAEERRQIAYAGIALEQLMQNYHELIIDYANESELQKYLQLLHQYSIARAEEALNSQELTRPDSNFTNSEVVDERKQLKANLEQKLSELRKNLDELTLGKIKPNQFVVSYYSPLGNMFQKKVIFDQRNCIYWAVCTSSGVSYSSFYLGGLPHSFYSFSTKGENTEKYWLDRLLIWNASRANAYKNIKNDMPIESLLILQQKYFDYFRGISTSFSKEYDYDADIPLDVPFLKPL